MDLSKIKNILVVRTDRIGDVLLSTPVLENLRKSFPKAHIAVMVSPNALDIVQGNPNINEVIVYDKDNLHKTWSSSIKFALKLRKKKFDLSLIVHPTNRSHIIAFFSGIKYRVGYDRKFSFLLTQKIPHTKQHGEKHERDYCLDMLSVLGLQSEKFLPQMVLRKESEEFVDNLLNDLGLNTKQEKIVAMHPGASCPSKRWPLDYFSKLAQWLIKDKKTKIAIIGAKDNLGLGDRLAGLIDSASVINFTGRLTISQLASFLKRCCLFISNDSGPVHIASSVGTPVISIFGRKQPGLAPKRWGPLGKLDKVVHKDVGCTVCLAHNCNKNFLCLRSISPEEVYQLAVELL
jgi:heptosyltransferase-2